MRKLLRDRWVWILFSGSLFLCWLFVGRHGIFGSRVDWVNQHSVLPDYFRQRFYETGNLFPDMAWNLGGGQNIYNLAYYGLFNPVILLSYLMPFVSMDSYIMGSSAVCYGISVAVFYWWLGEKGCSFQVRLGCACMFGLAAPLIYHSYNQLMFVNYMPFLILAFGGTDRYFKKGKREMLLAGLCGMIFSSFYFSIGGMGALGIYGIGEYLWPEAGKDGESRRKLFREKGRQLAGFAGNFFLAVMLSGILLVPSAYSILSGRQEDVKTGIDFQMFAVKPERFFYSAYGIGLTSFVMICLIAGLICYKTWRERWNCLCVLILFNVPVFGYLLNGGLYDKDKVFIPFLPLVCLEIARYCEKFLPVIQIHKNPKWRLYFPYVITIILVCVERNYGAFTRYWPLILIDACLMLALYFFYQRYPRLPWPLLASCVILFLYGLTMNAQQGRMLSEDEYSEIKNEELREQIQAVLDEDMSLYRLDTVGNGTENQQRLNRIEDIRQNITSLYSSAYNAEYHEFRKNIFAVNEPFRNHLMQSVTDNPCFLQLMGVKYIAAKKAPDGYELFSEGSGYNIYKSSSAAPLFYVTDQVIAEEEYKKLNFPDNQTALLRTAVIPENEEHTGGNTPDDLEKMRPCALELPLENSGHINLRPTKDGYQIEAKKETELEAKISGWSQGNTLLAVRFQVENEKPNQDMHIRIQEQTNRLSAENHEYANHNREFTYMVTPDQDGKVKVKLGKGKYRISDIQAYAGSMEKLRNRELYGHPVEGRNQKEKDDKFVDDSFAGTAEAGKGGYLISSIPYDENFIITVDGEKVPLLKVNTSFLGARIEAGKHEIEITYAAPGKVQGFLMSIAGILVLVFRKLLKITGI